MEKCFCWLKGEGLSGILINFYCHMWEGTVTRGCGVGMSLPPGSSLSNRLTEYSRGSLLSD